MAGSERDYADLFRCLNARGAEYLVAGTYASGYYGVPRFSERLELAVNPDPENARRVLGALGDFGFSDLTVGVEDLSDPSLLLSLGYPPHELDIVTQVDGLSWPEVWKNRCEGSFRGESVIYLGLRDLIRLKRASGDPGDSAMADALEHPAQRSLGDEIPP